MALTCWGAKEGPACVPPQPSPSQRPKLTQNLALNLLRMNRGGSLCRGGSSWGGLWLGCPFPGVEGGSAGTAWAPLPGERAGRYGSAVALAPRQPPGSWGAKALWAAGPGSRPMSALGERGGNEGAPAHAVPSVGGVGREWGKEQWWELWEGGRERKKKEKQWKNTSSGPLAAPPGPSPPQDYCTKKCYFCFNNLLRHWHSSAGLVLSSSPAPRDHCSSMAKGAGRGPPGTPVPTAASPHRRPPLPAGAPGVVPGGSRPAGCQEGGWRCQRPPRSRGRGRAVGGGARSRAVLATSAGSEGGEGAGTRPGVAPAPGAPLKRVLPIERRPEPRGVAERGASPGPSLLFSPRSHG